MLRPPEVALGDCDILDEKRRRKTACEEDRWSAMVAGENPAESSGKSAGLAGLLRLEGFTVRFSLWSSDFCWIYLASTGKDDRGSGQEVALPVADEGVCVTCPWQRFRGISMRFASSTISFLLAVLVPALGYSAVFAGEGCCGRVAAAPSVVPVLAAPVQYIHPLVAAPAPCCGGTAVLPVAAYPSTVAYPAATVYPPAVLVPPGYHIRHPYYSYRAPWGVPGPPMANQTITW
jgi:hypothetical protein